MTRAAWVTDIHFEFLTPAQITAFCVTIKQSAPDVLLVTGDIGNAPTICDDLRRLRAGVGVPLYVVLGNHDYYGGKIDTVRDLMPTLATHDIHWMPSAGVVTLAPGVGLVGHGGWSDGGYGDFMASEIILSDYMQINDLIGLSKSERRDKLRALGMSAAKTLRPHLFAALRQFPQVIVLTHAPPFLESCWHEGKTPAFDDPYLPHFTCKAIGDLLREAHIAHPDARITVLCGHTHGNGEAHPLPNLHVITGGAVYGQPIVQRIFDY